MKKVFAAIGGWLKRFFTSNWKMKLGALALAFLLWSFVLAEENPPKEKIFSDIPVSYSTQEVLRLKGLTSAEPFSDVLKEVSVTVEANADRLADVKPEMISAEVNLSAITEPGEYTLPVSASAMIGTVKRVSPAEATFTIEQIETREVPVEVKVDGENQAGLYYGNPVLTSSTVEITGASSNVEQVAKAICEIDVSGMAEPTTETRTVTLVKDDGTVMGNEYFTGIPSVIVEIPIYPEKSVPVNTSHIADNAVGVADGYEITGVTVMPETVEIAGKQDIIDGVYSVEVEPIALDNAAADKVVDALVVVPDGVYAVTPATVKVQITIGPKQEERVYPAVDIDVKNLGEGLSAALQPASVDVTVTGTKAQLDAFTASLLKPFVDLTGMGAGTHEAEIKFENEPDLTVGVKPSVAKVQVTITSG